MGSVAVRLPWGREYAAALVDDEDLPRLSGHRWRLSSNGYVHDESDRKLHHAVLGPGSKQRPMDHSNGDKLDNRRSNLRRCTPAQNAANRRKCANILGRPCTSQYKGVSWASREGKWRCTVAGRSVGYYTSEAEAARAYDFGARAKYGCFARLNFPDPDSEATP